MADGVKYYFLEDLNGIYSAPECVEGGSAHDRVQLVGNDCSPVYDIYDDLAARFPEYVTKIKEGEASGFDLNRYKFSHFAMENRSKFENRRFKILITTAIHGDEQGCAWTAAQFFRLMCENPDDPILGFLRRNVVFDVIPVANPYGYLHDIRRNGRGVDINRNFDANFQVRVPPEHDYYGGAEPGSEIETQMLMRLIEENLDAEYAIDYHNIGKGYPLLYVQNEHYIPLANSVFAALTEKWTKEYAEMPRDQILGYVKPGANEGMYGRYAAKMGLKVFTLETPWCMPTVGRERFDKATIRCAMDVLVNLIVAIVKSYR